jgi:hypothetical protein
VVWRQLGLRLKGEEERREMGKRGGLNGFSFWRQRGNVEGGGPSVSINEEEIWREWASIAELWG